MSDSAPAVFWKPLRVSIAASPPLLFEDAPYMETTVAMVLLHFVRREAELAVIEVGIGGRLDATNVLDPLVSVITPISYDHMEMLGSTLHEIAREKSGIIRPGGYAVSAPQAAEARDVLRQVCTSRGAQLVEVGRDVDLTVHSSVLEGVRATIQGRRGSYDVTIPLLGRHQAVNAATAAAATEALAGFGLEVGPSAPCRRGARMARGTPAATLA